MANGNSIGPKIQVDGVDSYYRDIQRVIAQGKQLAKQMKDTGEEFDDAGESSSRFADVLKANLTSEAIIGGLKVLGKGILEVGKAFGSLVVEGVKSFAELEQNIGGSEAVFGEFASSIQKTAEQAYRTMGTTQSEYLATANKMGALFQGSGLDAQRSMDLTTQAMQRAADMASVMGIDTQSALDAVTGAAKGNYTMMDNLGVAMNATTLEAYRVSQGMDTAFSKMSNAEKAELAMKYFFENTTQYAGNFEREASETISGSIGQLTAAVQTWVAGLGNSEADITVLTQNIVNAFQSVVANVVPVVENIVATIPTVLATLMPAINQLLPMLLTIGADVINTMLEGITSALPALVSAAKPIISVLVTGVVKNLGPIIKTGVEILLSLIDGIADTLPDLIPMAVEVIETVIEGLVDNLPKIVETGINVLASLIQGLTNAIPKLVQFIPRIITTFVQTITQKLPQIIQMGITTLTSLIEGLTQALPQLVQMLPQIITTIVSYITNNLPQILKMGVEILLALAEGIVKSVGNLASAGWEIIKTLVGTLASLPSQMWDIGKEVVSGIWEGISDSYTWIKNKIKGWVGNVTKFIKNLFGIHSPSTVMRDQVGKYLALGIGEGFTDEMKYVAKNMVAAVPMDFSVGSGVTNMGGVTIQVYGAPGQDERVIAQRVSEILNRQVINARAVFA